MSAFNSSRIFHGAFELDLCPCAPVWSDQSRAHLAQFPDAFTDISRGSFWLRTKAIITIVSIPGWVTPREQNTLSMKMCTSERAGIVNLDEASRAKCGACAAGAHQAASLGTNFQL